MANRRRGRALGVLLIASGLALGTAARAGDAGEPAPPTPHPGTRLLVPPHDASQWVHLFRYEPGTGRTWFNEGHGDEHFVEVAETGALPAGPFAVEASVLEARQWELLRVNERSGRTWGAYGQKEGGRYVTDAQGREVRDPNQERWFELKEPQGADAAEPTPEGDAPAYLLRTIRLPTGTSAMRCRRDTGRTWIAAQAGWERILEGAKPGPGTYEWQFVRMEKESGLGMLRFDTRTGRLWGAGPGSPWRLVPEATGEAKAQPVAPGAVPYGWLAATTSDNLYAIRFHPVTGQMWILGGEWYSVDEEHPAPPGDYRFALVPGEGEQPSVAVRLDAVTGELWRADLRRGTWAAHVPPVLDRRQAGPFARARFELRASAASQQAYVVRFDRVTGAASVLDGALELLPVAEPDPIEPGEFDVTLNVSGTGQAFLVRLERRTGAWWTATAGTWTPVQKLPPPLGGSTAPRFSQRAMATREHASAARIDVRTGDVRLWKPDSDGYALWPSETSAEENPIPEGEYALYALEWGGERRGRSVTMVRFDQASGRVWWDGLKGKVESLVRTWVEVK